MKNSTSQEAGPEMDLPIEMPRELTSEYIDTLIQTVSRLVDKASALEKENAALKAENKKLEEKVKELESRINKNSTNSSKPPSSDGYNKPPKNRSLREASGKKPGGQKGHMGHGMVLPHEPDEVVERVPAQCMGCACAGTCAGTCRETRYGIDLEINVKVTQYNQMEFICPVSGRKITGDFDEDITGTHQYGKSVRSVVVLLYMCGIASHSRIAEMVSGMLGMNISTGTVSSIISKSGELARVPVEMIRLALKQQGLLHVDETGIRVDRSLKWLHVVCTELLTYLVPHDKRGQEGIAASGVLEGYERILVHDCWAPYFKLEDCLHAVCDAHLMRELVAVFENTGQQWAKDMIALFQLMYADKENKKMLGINALTDCEREEYSKLYDKIVEEAKAENPIPEKPPGKRGRPKRGKTRALVDRLETHKASVCLFIADFTVPFSNNQSERDLRMSKVRMNVSGCFRTTKGAINYARLQSYLSTARKNGVAAFQAIRYLIDGKGPQIVFGRAMVI
jgi:transposase